MKLLDGKQVSEDILVSVAQDICSFNLHPTLGVVLVGNDSASHLYVTLKERAASRVGIRVEKHFLSEYATQEDVESVIRSLNEDKQIHGILIQLPLPAHLDTDAIIGAMLPEKDVDGFHPENERKLLAGVLAFPPVFPRAILELARSSGEVLREKHAVIIGNSARFGDMMCAVFAREGVVSDFLFQSEYALVEGIESMKKADIVVTACGKAHMIKGHSLSSGVILIDGGIVTEEGKVIGDVDCPSVEHLGGYLSPVPGGVGPVTIACLLANVVMSAMHFEK